MDERTRIWLMMGISAVVLLACALAIVLFEGINAWTLISFAILVIVVIFALYFVTGARRTLRSGYPIEDERSRYLGMRAGYRAFYVSMYLVLALAFVVMLLEDRGVTLSCNEMLFVVTAMMGSIYLAFSAYYNRKGKVSIE
jgi:uncharacterized membrane protein